MFTKVITKTKTILKIGDFLTKSKIFPHNPFSNISMQEHIQDNDNYKPHANNYLNLSMFTKVIV